MIYNISGMLVAVHEAYKQAYEKECTMRIEYARIYDELHGQHDEAINELKSVHQDNQSLHRQLETMRTLESAFQEQQRTIKANNAVVHQSQFAQSEWALERGRLEARIAKLEDEKSEMAQDHHNALANAADHIREVSQRADELERLCEGTSDPVQTWTAEHDNATPPKRANRPRKRKTASK